MIRFLVSLLFLACSFCLIAQEESDPFSGGAESGGGEGGAGGGPLPIELLRFEARPEGQAVVLAWSTATEIDNDFFSLERSRDAVRWEPVATVDGAGTHYGQLDYTYRDEKPLQGLSYYRLRQTDFDGSFSYSPLVVVDIASSGTAVLLYPNPSQGEVFLEPGTDGPFTVEVYSLQGQLVHTAADTRMLSLGHLPAGHYLLRIATGQGVTALRLERG